MTDVNSKTIIAIANNVINLMLLHSFQWRKQTPLQRAVESNNRDVVELLLRSGADVNEKDEASRIPYIGNFSRRGNFGENDTWKVC